MHALVGRACCVLFIEFEDGEWCDYAEQTEENPMIEDLQHQWRVVSDKELAKNKKAKGKAKKKGKKGGEEKE